MFSDMYIVLPPENALTLQVNRENARQERIRMFEKLTTFNLAPLACVCIPSDSTEYGVGAVYMPDRLKMTDVLPLLERLVKLIKDGHITRMVRDNHDSPVVSQDVIDDYRNAEEAQRRSKLHPPEDATSE